MKTSRLVDTRWMSLRDFANKHDINLRTLQRYAENGKLPCKKMGPKGAWYVDLQKWNELVEIYAEHEEVCTSVVTGFEPGMRRYKLNYKTDDTIEISNDDTETKFPNEDE